MPPPREITGSCLCGTVAYTVHGPYKAFYLCHCTRCRKKTGSAHASNIFAGAENFRLDVGRGQYQALQIAGSRSLFNMVLQRMWFGSATREPPWASYGNPAGTLDGDLEFQPQYNIHWHDRADWYDDGKAAPCCDGDPP